MQFITQIQPIAINIIMNEILSGDLECDGCMLMLIITEHPAYPYTQPQMLPDVGRVTYPECL